MILWFGFALFNNFDATTTMFNTMIGQITSSFACFLHSFSHPSVFPFPSSWNFVWFHFHLVGVSSSLVLDIVFFVTINDWFYPLLPNSSRLSLWVCSMEHSISSQSSSPIAQQPTIHLSETLPFQYPVLSSSSCSSCTSSWHSGGSNSSITMQNRKISNILFVFCFSDEFVRWIYSCGVNDKFDYTISVTFFLIYLFTSQFVTWIFMIFVLLSQLVTWTLA